MVRGFAASAGDYAGAVQADEVQKKLADIRGRIEAAFRGIRQAPNIQDQAGHAPYLKQTAQLLLELVEQLERFQTEKRKMSKTNIPREPELNLTHNVPEPVGGRGPMPAPDTAQTHFNPDGTVGGSWPNRGGGNDFVPPSSGGGSE
ncbi:MAG TPA: hypothetical protein VH643_29310 [Gemmataceae bacterium]|jgi:hypothetical protein